ncbi:MAG TPA: amino acid permease [Bacteroidia bacterium]|nr:amino acid permease [Bacteroidia bacterium]
MPELKRSLNLFDTVMLVSGSMIGSGIFIVSADMMRVLQSPFWVLICWLLSGFITILAALSYGELAGMMPDAGGQFIYIKRAFGKLTSFVYGWTVFTVIQTGVIAAVAVAFARFTSVLFPVFDEHHILFYAGKFSVSAQQVLAVLSILALSYLNSMGIRNGQSIQRVFTSAKLLSLLGLIVLGFSIGYARQHWQQNLQINPYPAQGPAQGSWMLWLGAIGVALIGSLFSSDAWNNVTFIAGEIKQPQRNIPLGLVIGVCLVTVLYILANVAYFMLLPAMGSPEGHTVLERGIAYARNDRVGTAAIFTIFGNAAEVFMAVLIMISTFGCNNGLILAGARLFKSMADEKLFFPLASRLNSKQVPSNAIWLQALWASVLCLSGSYSALLDYCTFASLVFYIITIFALFKLRRSAPTAHRPYKALAYPVLPALYILLASGVCISLICMKTSNTLLGILIMALGLPVYMIFTRQKHVA